MFSEATRRVTHLQMQRNRNRETAFREQQSQVAKITQNVRNFKRNEKIRLFRTLFFILTKSRSNLTSQQVFELFRILKHFY